MYSPGIRGCDIANIHLPEGITASAPLPGPESAALANGGTSDGAQDTLAWAVESGLLAKPEPTCHRKVWRARWNGPTPETALAGGGVLFADSRLKPGTTVAVKLLAPSSTGGGIGDDTSSDRHELVLAHALASLDPATLPSEQAEVAELLAPYAALRLARAQAPADGSNVNPGAPPHGPSSGHGAVLLLSPWSEQSLTDWLADVSHRPGHDDTDGIALALARLRQLTNTFT